MDHQEKLKIGEQFYDRLANFIKKRVGNIDDAQDITQDVFTKLSENKTISNENKLLSWLFVTARNSIIDYYRRKGKNNLLPLKDEPIDLTIEERVDISKCITPLLSLLNNEDHSILVDIDMNGLSQKEFSEKSGIPYPTTKSKVQRARKKFKDLLMNCCEITLDTRGIPIDCNDNNCC